MDSNTHSTPTPDSRGPDDGLAGLAAEVAALAAQDLDGLTDTVRAERVLVLRRLVDRLEGQWLKELAGVDGRGAAGADQGEQTASTAGWLRRRLRLSAGAAHGNVRTARALFRGPLTETAAALVAGAISPAHARVVVDGTHQLPSHLAAEAELVLVEVAGRLDPPGVRQAVRHLGQVVDPEGADRQAERRHGRRGLWLSATWQGMVAVDGLLDPEAGSTVLAALEPLARPATAEDARSGGQRRADALTELARRSLEGGWLPKAGGVRPQLLVTVDLDSLLGRPGAVGGEVGGAVPLAPETCRRLACDGTVTRVVVARQPGPQPDPAPGQGVDPDPDGRQPDAPSVDPDPSLDAPAAAWDPGEPVGLHQRLRAAVTRLPPTLGGAARQPLEVGRATRVVQPAQRAALAVRDGGCVFPGCDRPLGWCDAHHLHHWVEGGGWPDRPGQPGPVVPGSSSGGP